MPAPSKSNKGFAGILAADLYFPENSSLKDKRMYLRRIKEQTSRRFGASFAEVGYHELWQRSRVLMTVAASDSQVLEQTLERLREYLDSQEWMLTWYRVEVVEVDA